MYILLGRVLLSMPISYTSIPASHSFPSSRSPSTGSSSFAKLSKPSVLLLLFLTILANLPAMPKGAPNPSAIPPLISHPNPNPLSVRTHKTPVTHSEKASKRVEWNVAARALWVVVWRRHSGARGRKGTAAEGGDGAGGEHFD